MSRQRRQRRAARQTEAPPEPPAPVITWSWSRDGLLALAAAVIAFAVFANSIGNDFVFDDVNMIRENARLDHPGDLALFFRTSYWGSSSEGSRLYRPLTVWSFAIDRAVFGPGPLGVHLMNVLANAAVAGLVYAVVLVLLRRRTAAFVTAVLFAIHPVHTEVVANGVGRAELYAAVAGLAAILMHLRYVGLRAAGPVAPGARRGRGRGRRARAARGAPPPPTLPPPPAPPAWPWLTGAALLYFVALLFKESAAVLPGLLLLMEWLVIERGDWRTMTRRVGRYLVYVPPLAVFLVMRTGVIGPGLPAVQEVMAGATGGQRMLFASETLLRYLGQLLYPMTLVAEYADYRNLIRPSASDPMVLASLVAWPLLAATLAWLVMRREWTLVLAAAWFALAILPVSNLLFPIGTVRADRLLFVPSFGFALAAGCLLDRGLARGGAVRLVAAAALSVAVGFYLWRSATRNLDWRSQERLWTMTLAQNPGSAVGWSLLGDELLARGEAERAAEAFRRAFELRDGAGFFYPEAHNRYATVLNRLGRTDEAIEQYRLVLEEVPAQPTAMMNLGEALLHRAETRDEAIEVLTRLGRLTPDDFRVFVNLAQALKLAGRLDDARAAIDRAAQLRPGEAFIWQIKAEIEQLSARPDEARRALEQARRLRGG